LWLRGRAHATDPYEMTMRKKKNEYSFNNFLKDEQPGIYDKQRNSFDKDCTRK
jgi:hypothetical protein